MDFKAYNKLVSDSDSKYTNKDLSMCLIPLLFFVLFSFYLGSTYSYLSVPISFAITLFLLPFEELLTLKNKKNGFIIDYLSSAMLAFVAGFLFYFYFTIFYIIIYFIDSTFFNIFSIYEEFKQFAHFFITFLISIINLIVIVSFYFTCE